MASSDFHVGDLQGQIEEINEHIASVTTGAVNSNGVTGTWVKSGRIVCATLKYSASDSDQHSFTGLPVSYNDLLFPICPYNQSSGVKNGYINKSTNNWYVRAYDIGVDFLAQFSYVSAD